MYIYYNYTSLTGSLEGREEASKSGVVVENKCSTKANVSTRHGLDGGIQLDLQWYILLMCIGNILKLTHTLSHTHTHTDTDTDTDTHTHTLTTD